MTIKRAVLILIVGVVSVATFPLSVPVLIVAGLVWWYRRRTLLRMVPTARVYELQLVQLELRLAEAKRETEALTRVKYTAWKIRHEKERQYFIAHGVTLPQTERRALEDEMFTRLEQRMADEQKRFRDELARAQRHEQLRLEDQRRQLVDQSKAEDRERIAQQQQELEQARIEAEREAAALVSKALQADLA